MSERPKSEITITEEDFFVGDNYSQADGSRYFYLHTPMFTNKKEAEQLKQQILQDQKLRQVLDTEINLLMTLVEKKKEQNEPFKWVSDMIDTLKKLQQNSEK